MRHTLSILLLTLVLGTARSQSLPVGTPGLEDYYRRAQLMGIIDSSFSFCARPFFPVEALKIENAHDPLFTEEQHKLNKNQGTFQFLGSKGTVQLLPITWQQQFNTHHPYSLNDGAMIPGRGYQTMISGGFFAKLGHLSIQFRPELIYAENKPFETFTSFNRSDGALAAYYYLHNDIDLPERFKNNSYKTKLPGQSSIRLTFGPVSAGLSSENLWWGPGTRNSLLMSNSGPGFYHFTLNTVKPVRTPIGSFEGQIIGGKLDPSNSFGADTNVVVNGTKLYVAKRDDWRYLNGMVLTYQPRWVNGLFVGLTRSFMVYHQDMRNKFSDYFRIFSPVDKKQNTGEGEQSVQDDQLFSVFARWLLPEDHAELYFEYGREDHSYDLRDLTLQPDHYRAYIIGFRKLFLLNNLSRKYIQLNLELTQMEQNRTNVQRSVAYFYFHGMIRHGYTNQGQMLGAGIGPGSNLQSLSVSWGHGLNNLGFQIERYVHNNDLHYNMGNDIRAHWVDINLALRGEWSWQNLLFSAKLEGIRSFNYEHNYVQKTSDLNYFWTPGLDVYNFQANLGVTYRF